MNKHVTIFKIGFIINFTSIYKNRKIKISRLGLFV